MQVLHAYFGGTEKGFIRQAFFSHFGHLAGRSKSQASGKITNVSTMLQKAKITVQ